MARPPAHDTLRAILVEAGRYAQLHRGDAQVERKTDGSVVSSVDRLLDARLAAALRSAFPGVGLCGEEGSQQRGRGVFYIDPIDGTHAWLNGLAYWGPTVAYAEDGILRFGAFYLPDLDTYWFAGRGEGAWRNGVPIVPRRHPSSAHQRVLFAPSRIHRAPFPWTGKIRVLGSTAAHLALVATGAGACAFIPRWSPWDVGCGALLVTESGGVLSGLDGATVDLVGGVSHPPFLAGEPDAVQEVVRAFRDHEGSTDGCQSQTNRSQTSR